MNKFLNLISFVGKYFDKANLNSMIFLIFFLRKDNLNSGSNINVISQNSSNVKFNEEGGQLRIHLNKS